MADTFWGKFMRSTKLCGLFFSWLCFSDTDCLDTQTLNHMELHANTKNANVLGHVQTWCPCQDSVPWHWKECCSYTVVPKTMYIFPFNSLRCCNLVTTATSNHREMCKKRGTDEILCKQAPGYGAWILPSKRVPVPGYRAHVFVRAPLKCYVHICTRAQAPNPGPSLDRTLTNIFTLGVVVQSRKPSGSYSIIMHDCPRFWWES